VLNDDFKINNADEALNEKKKLQGCHHKAFNAHEKFKQ
jgi:hypothetical protein